MFFLSIGGSGYNISPPRNSSYIRGAGVFARQERDDIITRVYRPPIGQEKSKTHV